MNHDPGTILPRISFGREVCGDLSAADQREWLVTNGVGGYACGSVSGILNRRYHGLLVAALVPPGDRTLLLSHLDETADYKGRAYQLFTHRWSAGEVNPTGYQLLERFTLEGTVPVWVYAFQDALLEKRIWMEQGANTTYVRYTLLRGSAVTLSVKALVNHRSHHGRQGDWQPAITRLPNGLNVEEDLYLIGEGEASEVVPASAWYRGYFLARESYRGLDPLDDHLFAGRFRVHLKTGESWTLTASTSPEAGQHVPDALVRQHRHERSLLRQSGMEDAPERVRHLVLASDQFLVKRTVQNNPDGHSIIAGYPWFADWGRDSMIALPGLTLAAGRIHTAGSILQTFAGFLDKGMLPNNLPERGEAPGADDYNTVDAALWFLEAVRAWFEASRDTGLLRKLYPGMKEIIHWYEQGTRYGIGMDPGDSLLSSGEPGIQLTWMDAKIGEWVVTPRSGKAVEINALWYNGLRILQEAALNLGQPAQAQRCRIMADRVQASFSRFWNAEQGYCFDVLDTPAGSDASLRPNQLLAVSLHHSPLDRDKQRAVVDACARSLLTSHGLRSLAPDDPAYRGHYGGDQHHRDSAYHQGTVWAWLTGPFVSAHLRVYGDRSAARSFLEPLLDHLSGGCTGSLSEIFDGEPPYTPRGAFAQAWSVAEVLRAWKEVEQG